MPTPKKAFFSDVFITTIVVCLVPIFLMVLIWIIPLILDFIRPYQSSNYGKSSSANLAYLLYSLVFVLLISLLVLWRIPKYQLRELALPDESDARTKFDRKKEKIKLEDDIRKTLAQIIAGCFVVVTVYSTYVSFELSRKTRNTEQISNAMEALENKDDLTSSRGMYLLERAIEEVPEDREGIINFLCTYLQDTTRRGQERTASGNRITRTIFVIIKLSPKAEERIDLTNLDLRNLNLELNETFPTNVDLSGTDLTGIRMNGVDLGQAILQDTVFTDVDLSRVNLGRSIVNLSGADLRKVRLFSYRTSPGFGPGSELGEAICEKDRDQGYVLKYNCDLKQLKGSNLSHVNLSGNVTLGSAQLVNVNLTGANLSNTALTNADLSNAILKDTNLTGTSLVNTVLYNVDLSTVIGITLDQLKGALINEKTTLSTALKPYHGVLLALSKKKEEEKEKNKKK